MNNSLQFMDLTQLDSIACGDEDFKKELIVIFLEQIPDFISSMNQFFNESKWEKLAREAHTAKSSVLIFGMTDTGQLLKDIELWAENKNTGEIGAALKQAEEDLKQAETELQNLLKEG